MAVIQGIQEGKGCAAGNGDVAKNRLSHVPGLATSETLLLG